MHAPSLRRAAWLAGVGLAGVALAVGACGSGEPAFRPVQGATCPDRMVPIPGSHACIDTHEARIEADHAVPATNASAADGLTWYEAERACRASGFRLCTLDEFEVACAGVGRERTFPYGSTHEPGRCNVAELTDDLATRAVTRSGAFPECRTPEGVYDLSGNVFEWLAEEGGGGGLMAMRGGNAFQPYGSARCVPDEHGWLAPEERGGGFRCCFSLARAE